MPTRPQSAVPLASALQDSQPLARLTERLNESRRRFECIEALLPPSLAAQVRPGPLDEHGWTLLALTPGAAAKLRQFVPMIEAQLDLRAFPSMGIRIRVR